MNTSQFCCAHGGDVGRGGGSWASEGGSAPGLTTSLVVHDDRGSKEDVCPAVVVARVGMKQAVVVGEVRLGLQPLGLLHDQLSLLQNECNCLDNCESARPKPTMTTLTPQTDTRYTSRHRNCTRCGDRAAHSLICCILRCPEQPSCCQETILIRLHRLIRLLHLRNAVTVHDSFLRLALLEEFLRFRGGPGGHVAAAGLRVCGERCGGAEEKIGTWPAGVRGKDCTGSEGVELRAVACCVVGASFSNLWRAKM